MSREARILTFVVSFAAATALAAALVGWLTLRASLPQIDGTATAPGLNAPVNIVRDDAGVPTISAANRVDLARGLGYVHGQDRFFEMDLMRRAAAGELSALFGAALLPTDRELRVHRFRAVAQRVVANLDPPSRALLDAYVEGVNQGLKSLRSRPFEYWVLRSRPQPWNAADSVLCVQAMFLQLQQPKGQASLQRGLLRAALPPAMWRFLNAPAPEWEAAIDATRSDEPQVPRADEYDLRSLKDAPVLPPEQVLREISVSGSNNWAVTGARTANGAAIVADDMHLDFRVPIIWYRARMRTPQGDAAGAKDSAIDVTGVTLPGTPGVIAGSNGHIAWGSPTHTASSRPWCDWFPRRTPARPSKPRTGQSP